MRYVAIAMDNSTNVLWLANDGAAGFLTTSSKQEQLVAAKAIRTGVSAAGGVAGICQDATGPFVYWTLADLCQEAAGVRTVMNKLRGSRTAAWWNL